ncbi:hypothetical protein [Streptomyces sp. NPDC003635]
MDQFERQLAQMMRSSQEYRPLEPSQRERLHEAVRTRRRLRAARNAAGSVLAVAALALAFLLRPDGGRQVEPTSPPPVSASTAPGPTSTPTSTPTSEPPSSTSTPEPPESTSTSGPPASTDGSVTDSSAPPTSTDSTDSTDSAAPPTSGDTSSTTAPPSYSATQSAPVTETP